MVKTNNYSTIDRSNVSLTLHLKKIAIKKLKHCSAAGFSLRLLKDGTDFGQLTAGQFDRLPSNQFDRIDDVDFLKRKLRREDG